jgi:flagellar motor protein MotB
MVEERKTAPIIITKKRKKAHAAHHGGAWKVAYADFVTAMMAFFLVMWLVGQSDAVKQSVSGYFRDPVAFGEGAGVLEGGEAAVPVQPTAAEAEQQQALEQARREAEEAVRNQLAQAGQAIQKLLDESPELQSLRDQIEQSPHREYPRGGCKRVEAAVKPHRRRGAHRRQAIRVRFAIYELGIVRRPCEFGACRARNGRFASGADPRDSRIRGQQAQD